MQETWVQCLGWEDPLEKEMATHSSILAWRIPWREESCRLQSMGSQRVRHDWVTSISLSLSMCNVNANLPIYPFLLLEAPDFNQHTSWRWVFTHVGFLLHQWMLEPEKIFTNMDTSTPLPGSGLIGRMWGQCPDGFLNISRWFEWVLGSRTSVETRSYGRFLNV